MITTYQGVLIQAQNLPRAEQYRLLAELSATINPELSSELPVQSEVKSQKNLARWCGFLPKQIDALEFQQQIRQEWDNG